MALSASVGNLLLRLSPPAAAGGGNLREAFDQQHRPVIRLGEACCCSHYVSASSRCSTGILNGSSRRNNIGLETGGRLQWRRQRKAGQEERFLAVRASDSNNSNQNVETQATSSEADVKALEARLGVEDGPGKNDKGSAMNQMFGIRGAAAEKNIWKIRLQLTKPVTWAPLIWGVACGAAASGNFNWGNPEDIAKAALCMFMSGPLLTGYTQTINDWYDKEIDAINEPYRPIPSGAIPVTDVIIQIWVLLLGGLGTAYLLDVWAGHDFPSILGVAVGGSLLSYIYSAPPLKLKQSGWIGNYALGSSYISLPWWSGQLLFGTLTPDIVVLTLLYSTAGLGIAIINDFKSIEGDRAMGLQSLPVAFGVDTAKWICAGTIDVTQLAVAAYLFSQGKTIYGLILLALIAPQIIFQFQYFLNDPIKNDVKYQASAQPFFVFGLLVTALATSH